MKEIKFIKLETLNQQVMIDFSGIYVFHNIDKDKYYVGQSHNVINRINKYFTVHSHNKELSRDLMLDEFEIALLDLNDIANYLNARSLNEAELNLIYYYKSSIKAFGYNKTVGNSSKRERFNLQWEEDDAHRLRIDDDIKKDTAIVNNPILKFKEYVNENYPKLLTDCKKLPITLLKALYDDSQGISVNNKNRKSVLSFSKKVDPIIADNYNTNRIKASVNLAELLSVLASDELIEQKQNELGLTDLDKIKRFIEISDVVNKKSNLEKWLTDTYKGNLKYKSLQCVIKKEA